MTRPPAVSESSHLLDLFMPLEFFYAGKGESLPGAKLLPGYEVPEPYRHLLVHQSDMTPRLREYHGSALGLEVIDRQVSDLFVMRLVVLHRLDNHAPVEIGAIGIQLEAFEPHTRAAILEGKIPLGAILERDKVLHDSAPKAYFSIEADEFIAALLKISPGTKLYGRCNALSHDGGIVFADIVEILPPA